MNVAEVVTVGVVVVSCVVYLIRRIARSSDPQKGSCKGCGDSCACVVQDIHKQSTSSGHHKK